MSCLRKVTGLLFIAMLISSCSINNNRTIYQPDYGRTTSLSSAKNPPPSTHHNICEIYSYDRQWLIAAKASEKKWGTPEHVLMAIIYQESKFVKHARPSYRGASTSSSYGYAQAQELTWKEYQNATNNPRAKRTDIKDSLDFIGWYNQNTHQRNKVSKSDAHNLYLAYHEGNGGFERKTYKSKPWLIQVAKKVDLQAKDYRLQLKGCRR